MHLLVSELRRFPNARRNDKKNLKIFGYKTTAELKGLRVLE